MENMYLYFERYRFELRKKNEVRDEGFFLDCDKLIIVSECESLVFGKLC